VGKHVLVVGGDNSAFDESLYLLALGVARITLIESMDRYLAAQGAQDALFSSGKARGRLQTRVHDLVSENGHLKAAILENTTTGELELYAVDGIFVFLGQAPNNALFRTQVALTEQGYIEAAADMSTNIPGVFGAGDINNKRYRRITTAMADGSIAALAAERWLRTGQKAQVPLLN
jgi:thioredoxin reductase (NADPH)